MSGCCEYQCDVELRRFRVRGLKCRKREILECARPPDQRNARYRGEMSLKAVGLDRESSLADLQGIGGSLACRPFLLHVRKTYHSRIRVHVCDGCRGFGDIYLLPLVIYSVCYSLPVVTF